jgi:hypothetical protein
MNNDVLFITEKWCDGDPNEVLTNNFHNLFNSLQSTNLYSTITLSHFDEIYYTCKQHYDYYIEEILDTYKPTVIVVSQLGNSHMNPTIRTYKTIKDRNIKLVFTWPDTREWVYDAIKILSPYADLHVSWACEQDDKNILDNNHIWLWTPEDPTLYRDDIKSTDVSFIGSINGYNSIRLNCINFLLQNKIPIFVSGGQREKKLSPEDYAKYIRTSKINVNFSESALIGTFQCKGRVFETLLSNSLLLEKKNECTRRRFTPGEHYIEFDNEIDLKDKIEYFLVNEKERIDIAKNGFDYCNKKYSAKEYWTAIFERIK